MADRCPNCSGVWLDHGELAIIAHHLRPAPEQAATSAGGERACRFCGAVLSAGATYCPVCFASLDDPATSLPQATVAQYAFRPLLWVVSAPVVLLIGYILLRALDAAWFLFLVGPPIVIACLAAAYQEWSDSRYVNDAASLARHRRLSFARWRSDSSLVERFAGIEILFQGGPVSGGPSPSAGDRHGTYRNQYVIQRRTPFEEIFAFTLYHDVFVGGSFAGGSKPAAFIVREGWDFPVTVIRPRTLVLAAATVASWADQDAAADDGRFEEQFSIEARDPAFTEEGRRRCGWRTFRAEALGSAVPGESGPSRPRRRGLRPRG